MKKQKRFKVGDKNAFKTNKIMIKFKETKKQYDDVLPAGLLTNFN